MSDKEKKCKVKSVNIKTEGFLEKTHDLNAINKVVSVVSGKGGVGKSLITAMSAVMLRRKGYRVGIMDADITGPSIPKMFGVQKKRPDEMEEGLFPVKTQTDIKIMSINLLLDQSDAPVIWRGPMIANTVKQFWTNVIWGDIDFLLIDMPPGTGDIPLTVFQSIPLDGIMIVTSPQDLVSLIVKKAYNMAKKMNIPILGIIENMSHVSCPKCGEKIDIFGESKAEQVALNLSVPLLGKIPIDPELADYCDKGEIEMLRSYDFCGFADAIEKMNNKKGGSE